MDKDSKPAPQLTIGSPIRWYKSEGKGTGWYYARLVAIEKNRAQIQRPQHNKVWVPLADVEYCAAR